MANVAVNVQRKYLFPEDYAEERDAIHLLDATFTESEVVRDAPRLAKDLAYAVIKADTRRNFRDYDVENVGNRYENAEWEIADEPDKDGMIRGQCNHIVSAIHEKRDNKTMYVICYQITMSYKQPKG